MLNKIYEEERAELFQNQWRYLLVVAAFLYSIFGFLDYFMTDKYLVELLSIRASIVILFLLSVIPTNLESTRKYIPFISIPVILWAGIGLVLMSTYVGGFSSSYFGGLLLVFYGISLFLPMPLWSIILVTTTISLSYIGINGYLFGFDKTAIGPIFFLCGAGGLALYSNILNAKTHKLDLKNRLDLEVATKAKERFFANISHELRTPLTLILGPLENLLHTNSNYIDSDILASMDINARRLLRQINQILDISKINNSEIQIHLENGNLVNIIDNLVEGAMPNSRRRKIALSYLGREVTPKFQFDVWKLETVIANLLSNALKFTDEYGHITIDTCLKEDEIVIQVSNSGKGIPTSNLQSVFELFKQVDDSDSRQHFGSGIGLYISKLYVEALGGKIHVSSVPRVETVFTVNLPYIPVAGTLLSKGTDNNSILLADLDVVEGQLTSSDIERLELANQNEILRDSKLPLVLYVEDNSSLRDYVKKSLQQKYRVVMAYDGINGLAQVKRLKPDFIISDQMMPRMTGTELCKIIKGDLETSTIPFLLLTAKASKADVLSGYEEGVDDYLVKPFNASELDSKISAQLRLKSMLENLGSITKDQNMKDFVGFMKHNVNNPLTIARVASGHLKNNVDTIDKEKIETLLEKLDNAIERITVTVAHMDKDSKLD